jgi:hypothetical protein
MKVILAAICSVAIGSTCFSQNAFSITGTPIPNKLVQQNYGTVPKGLIAYDLSICNAANVKKSIVSSEIYQAISNVDTTVQPLGRQVVLAAILRNRSHSPSAIFGVVLNSATTVLSILTSSKHVPPGLLTTAAVASISGQQILADLKPILSADQLQRFETEVLQPALVLDAGSCAERTVFATTADPRMKLHPLSFHVR